MVGDAALEQGMAGKERAEKGIAEGIDDDYER